MSEEISNEILYTINRLEMGIKNQADIDKLWGEVKALFLSEMSKLPDIPTSMNKKCNKKFRKCQPFWNNELELLWKEVCKTERLFTQLAFWHADACLMLVFNLGRELSST